MGGEVICSRKSGISGEHSFNREGSLFAPAFWDHAALVGLVNTGISWVA